MCPLVNSRFSLFEAAVFYKVTGNAKLLLEELRVRFLRSCGHILVN